MEWYMKLLGCVIIFMAVWKFFLHEFISEIIVEENGGLAMTTFIRQRGYSYKKTKARFALIFFNLAYILAWIYVIIVLLVLIYQN